MSYWQGAGCELSHIVLPHLICVFALALAAVPTSGVRLAAIGDFGDALNGHREQQVASLVASWMPLDGVLALGDCNYPYGEARTIDANVGQFYGQFIKPYVGKFQWPGRSQNAFWPCPGNHDWMTPDLKPYLDYMPVNNSRYYDVVVGNVHIFSLDSDPHEEPLQGTSASSNQGSWLRGRLLASQSMWRLVIFHHPPYSSGPHGSNLWMRWPFAEWGASAVLSGHDHLYERIHPPTPSGAGGSRLRAVGTEGRLGSGPSRFPYFVNGAGGATTYQVVSIVPGSARRYDTAPGAMLIDATATSLTFRFVSVDPGWPQIDCYSIAAMPPLTGDRTQELSYAEC